MGSSGIGHLGFAIFGEPMAILIIQTLLSLAAIFGTLSFLAGAEKRKILAEKRALLAEARVREEFSIPREQVNAFRKNEFEMKVVRSEGTTSITESGRTVDGEGKKQPKLHVIQGGRA